MTSLLSISLIHQDDNATYFQKKGDDYFPPWQRCSARQGTRPEVHRRSWNAEREPAPVHP